MVKYYIYGLQRSGTNIITTFINDNFDIDIVNNNHQERKDPHHKHFRIYDEKSFPVLLSQRPKKTARHVLNSQRHHHKVG